MIRRTPSSLESSGRPVDAVARVRERPAKGASAVVHPGWMERFPWLVQGTTTRGPDVAGSTFDLRLFPEAVGAKARWRDLLRWSGLRAGVHARQVHEADVRRHRAGGAPGLALSEACDGHVTADPDLLLAVSVADCVPVSVVDPERRALAMLHAGWRGAAAGILEQGLAALAAQGSAPDRVHVHLGPSICGRCYEVGPEVFEALGLQRPGGPTPIDLRAALAERAIAAGVSRERITISAHCTRCDPERRFFSHRGGDEGRQVGFLGTRP